MKEVILFFVVDSVQFYWNQRIDYLKNFNGLIGFQQKYYPTFLGLMILPFDYFFHFVLFFYYFINFFSFFM